MLPVCVGSFIYGLSYVAYASNISFLATDLKLSTAQTGYAQTVCMGVGVVVGILLPKLMKLFKAQTMNMGILAMAIGLGILVFAPNLVVLLIGAAFIGIAFGLYFPAGYAMVSTYSSGSPAAALATWSIVGTAGQILSPFIVTPLMGLFSDKASLRLAFCMVLCLIFVIVNVILTGKNRVTQTD